MNVSGVGALIKRFTFPESLDEWFPLGSLGLSGPLRFEKAFYPRHTDILFMKAIAENNKIDSFKLIEKYPAFFRLTHEQRESLKQPIREAFLSLEPQFEGHPEIVGTFLEMARRYSHPLPRFEVDLIYGLADLYQGEIGRLVEMKAYSVMTSHDLYMARNQVLLYACLATFGPIKLPIDRIEIVNCLTGQVWSWSWTRFLEVGERFYWILIMPIISNPQISDSEINGLLELYEAGSSGPASLSRIIFEKTREVEKRLRDRISQLEARLREEITSRDNIIRKYKSEFPR